MTKRFLVLKSKRSWWPSSTPDRIPIEPGRHMKEWDIIDAEMPTGWREEYNASVDAEPHQLILPVGFNVKDLPKDAEIVTGD